jgi:hypothetical protein
VDLDYLNVIYDVKRTNFPLYNFEISFHNADYVVSNFHININTEMLQTILTSHSCCSLAGKIIVQ